MKSVATALPANYVSQELLFAALRDYWNEKGIKLETLERLHKATKVSGRYLALPIEEYRDLHSFEKSNRAWMSIAPELAARAARRALYTASIRPQDVDHVFSVTGTGLATPSIDVRIISSLGMRPDLKGTPIFGLGCAGGASGIAHAADYVRAFPNECVLLIVVELCSLTLQPTDVSVANQIAFGLFSDGAAAVVIRGADRGDRGTPRVVASRSLIYCGTENVMGWQITDRGFKIVMSPDIPDIISQYIARDVDTFLGEHGLERRQIRHWVAHTGGPKVLRSIEAGLELPSSALSRSWDSLSWVGNLSSASVLFVFANLLQANEARPGDYGVMCALGPGFCLELVLLQW